MKKPLELRTVPDAKKAAKRSKALTVKTVSTTSGVRVRVMTLDANSASFSDDFLYAFKANVKAARKRAKARQAGQAPGKPGA